MYVIITPDTCSIIGGNMRTLPPALFFFFLRLKFYQRAVSFMCTYVFMYVCIYTCIFVYIRCILIFYYVWAQCFIFRLVVVSCGILFVSTNEFEVVFYFIYLFIFGGRQYERKSWLNMSHGSSAGNRFPTFCFSFFLFFFFLFRLSVITFFVHAVTL